LGTLSLDEIIERIVASTGDFISSSDTFPITPPSVILLPAEEQASKVPSTEEHKTKSKAGIIVV
jgi:hypothetical protein